MYTIKNNKLYINGEQVMFKQSPNYRKNLTPKYVILHYTGNNLFESAINTLTNKENDVSAHFVVGRGGELAQLVELDDVAFHAGSSNWKGLNGLNQHSFGIEMACCGPLIKRGKNFYSWNNKLIPFDEVYFDSNNKPWQTYTHKQLEVVFDITKLLVKEYKLIDVIGHEDVSYGRKTDPSISFPMETLRKQIFGRKNYL